LAFPLPLFLLLGGLPDLSLSLAKGVAARLGGALDVRDIADVRDAPVADLGTWMSL
jgi:hypothetical protein